MKLLTLPAVLLFAVLPAFADSFNVFMLQVAPDGHQTEIPLTPNGNPLIHSFGPPFEVQVDVPSFVTPIADPIVSVSVILGGKALPLFEPASLLLFGTGLAAVVWRKHRQASGHSP